MVVSASSRVPRHLPQLSGRRAQLRLTLMYSGMFLLLGTAVIVIIVVLVRSGATIEQTQSVASPTQGGQVRSSHAVALQQSADNARVLKVSWLALALTALASAFLGWFTAGRVLRPLRKMTATARTISAGNLHERLHLTGPEDEFKALGDTFDDLLARLEASFAAQRRFVANAAHELRTPLTLERTLLQVALADPNATAATLRATCEELLASGRGQERVLESLLILAISERGLETREGVDLAAVLRDVVEQSAAKLTEHGLSLESDIENGPVLGDRALLERLIANLLDNAVRYNRDGGFVQVTTGADADGAFVSVANSGPPIPAGAIERLFEPFERIGRERTSTGEAYGLGLSIVSAIAGAHEATVKAIPRDDGGLVVTVTFPSVE